MNSFFTSYLEKKNISISGDKGRLDVRVINHHLWKAKGESEFRSPKILKTLKPDWLTPVGVGMVVPSQNSER